MPSVMSARSNAKPFPILPIVLNTALPSVLSDLPVKPGQKNYARIWSSINDVCDLLHIPFVGNGDDTKPIFQHIQFKTGQRIHTIGQEFDVLYVVNSGFLKTVLIDEYGNEQVLSFPMKGDVLGVDCIHAKVHSTEAVALSDCNLILLPFKTLVEMARKNIEVEQVIYNVLSRELLRKQAMISLLVAPKAEARVARFLVFLSDKFFEMGYSKTIFSLRMTRQEIGSYLGLSLETVSRALSALNAVGLICVDQRAIKINESDIFKLLHEVAPMKQRANPYVPRKLRSTVEWENRMP